MTKLWNILLNLVYPLKCEICEQELSLTAACRICPACRGKIIKITDQYCLRCGKPLQIEPTVCLECRQNDRIYFDSVRAAGIYQGVLRESVRVLKYNDRSCLGRELGELMVEAYRKHFDWADFDYLIPVPLYRKQWRKRQYNQAQVLCLHLAEKTGIPELAGGLVRSRETRPQYQLTRQERGVNLRGAFRVNPKYDLAGKRVLVIDDISTTGTTINECARVLKQSGAEEVHGLVLAHG